MYFGPFGRKLQPSSLTYFCVAEQNKDSHLPSRTTPQWLTHPRILPLPLTPIMHPNSSCVAGHPIHLIDSCRASDNVQLPPLPSCYSPSICSIPSWRESSVTLFEEDTQPVQLSIQRDVAVEAGSSTVPPARVHVRKFV
jgi:hypothetical protein